MSGHVHLPSSASLAAAATVVLLAAVPAGVAGAASTAVPEAASPSPPGAASPSAPVADGADATSRPAAADAGDPGPPAPPRGPAVGTVPQATGVTAQPAPVRAPVADAPARARPRGEVCTFEKPAWRDAQSVAGVRVQESRVCRPDNPFLVAAATKGTDEVPGSVLRKSGLARDAVVKHTDRDGDGDPDVVEMTLEVHGLNEYGNGSLAHAIAPGIEPAFWVFAPKTRGMVRAGTPAARVIRMPSPVLRVEAGDTVRVTLENTHYLPHTIHFHGVDHPYAVNGSGNDGVPQTSERPVLPGDDRTYEFRPRQPGTMFYHCHVTPGVHVTMGLNGMFVVAEQRPDNTVQTINVGAGKVRHPSRAVREEYRAAYDLHYQDVDAELHRIPKRTNDPRVVAKRTNRVYDRTDAEADYFLLNGRSFPYTVRESLVVVEPDRRYRLRVLNGGSNTVSLHTHGHKVTVEAYDGVELSESNEITRDVAAVSAAQRVDLTLNTTDDGLHSYGAGVWFTHDHREETVTNDGIGPGGSVTMITYERYLGEDGVPRTEGNLSRFFSAAYYRGEEAKWGPLAGERLGAPNGTPTEGGTGHAHSGSATAHSHGGGETARLTTSHLVLLAFVLVMGLAVGIVLGRDVL